LLAGAFACAAAFAVPEAGSNALPGLAADADRRLDVATALVVGDSEPTLLFAQRAITPDPPAATNQTDPTQYTYVEIPGWKSPGQATAMSLVVPGTGQLYTGSSRGYIFLGIEALAIYTLTHFDAKQDEARDDYYSYVGDPYESSSRFSFERLGGSVDPGEVARLREVYAKDPREFYDTVSNDERYVAGWDSGDSRSSALFLGDDANHMGNRAQFGLVLGIANHLVAAFDALHLAKLNNIALREDLTLKLKLKPGLSKSSFAFTLTQKF
jgi:hypothetical protein